MMILAAQLSAFVAKAAGLNVVLNGSTIHYPGGFLIVGDPCSGLRSLISFLALGALFTQFVKTVLWKKCVLFASSVLIALLSNMVRIVFLIFVGYIYGQDAVHGFVHDASGVAVFIIGFIGLLGVSKLMGCSVNVGDE